MMINFKNIFMGKSTTSDQAEKDKKEQEEKYNSSKM